MGSFASSIFSVMLSWIRGAVSYLWQAASSPQGSVLLQWLAENWLTLALILCILGMAVDLVVYLLRWKPYKVWASFLRRITGRTVQRDDDQRLQRRTVHRRWLYADGTARTESVEQEELPEEEDRHPWQDVSPALPDYALDTEAYRRQYARPESQDAPAMASLNDYSTSAAEETAIPSEPGTEQAVEPVMKRSRRISALGTKTTFQQLFASHDEDELDLRYRPAKPAVDKEQAYSKPYYPPQWKPPADVGAATKDE